MYVRSQVFVTESVESRKGAWPGPTGSRLFPFPAHQTGRVPSAAVDHARLAFFLERVPEGLRVCIEFRNETWLQDSTFGLLEEHKAAYCVMSGARLPCVLRSTAPFVYARLHGPDHRHLYAGAYSDHDLRWWADRVREWQAMGRDVFVYFNNDDGGNAVRNALTLKGMVGA